MRHVKVYILLCVLLLCTGTALADRSVTAIIMGKVGNMNDRAGGGTDISSNPQAAYYGRNLDIAINVSPTFVNNAKAANSQLIATSYINLHYLTACADHLGADSVNNGNQDIFTFKKANDDMSSCWECKWLHYLEDSVGQYMQGSGTSCPGHSTETRKFLIQDLIASDSAKVRVSQDVWWNSSGDGYYPSGKIWITHSNATDFARVRARGWLYLLENQTHYLGAGATYQFNGFYVDNSSFTNPNGQTYIQNVKRGNEIWSWGGVTGGTDSCYGFGGCLDFMEIANPGGASEMITMFGWYVDACQFIGDTLKTEGFILFHNWSNGTASYCDDYLQTDGGEPVNHIFFEGRLFDLLHYATWESLGGGGNGDIGRMNQVRGTGTYNLWEARCLTAQANDTGDSYFAHASFGALLAIRDDSSVFCFGGRQDDVNNDLSDTLYLENWDVWDIDLGTPVADTYTLDSSGTTELGNKAYLISREYTNGYVYWLGPQSSSQDTSASNEFTFNAPENVYVIGDVADGAGCPGHLTCSTLYNSGNPISIRPKHVQYLVKAQAGEPYQSKPGKKGGAGSFGKIAAIEKEEENQ